MVRCNGLPSWISSARSDSVKPRSANLAPQYAPWTGIARQASTELTWTTVPPCMCLSAVRVPLTAPR